MPYYYRIFSLALEYPTLAQRESLDLALQALAADGSSEDAEVLRRLVLDGPLQAWREQHTGLFGSAGLYHLDLRFHLSDNPFDQARRLGQIAGSYRAFGCDAPEGRRHDELPLLLDFLGVLELKIDHALARGDEEQADIAFKASVGLIDEAVLPGLGSLAAKTEAAGVGGFYPPILKACLAALTLKMGAPAGAV